MSFFPTNFYAQWREKNPSLVFLHEGDAIPPERLLQAIWHHQRLLREQLKTLDGKTVRVLHPGFWNREAGPDFRGAVLQIDGEIKTGDVEIDLNSAGWHGHGHDRNPSFNNVILHVVWEPMSKNVKFSLLPLKSFLDAPMGEITKWLGSDSAQLWPGELSGQCCAPLRELSGKKLEELLQQAALVRFQRKAHEFEVRARQAGWEQSLWEGLFRALGYKQNVWPLRRLAELLPLLKNEKSPLAWQARLLGLGGLLPDDLSNQRRTKDDYLRRLWDIWWRERESFSELNLPKSLWKFNGLRPANRPERRLALAAHWLASEKFFPSLEKWFTSERPVKEAQRELYNFLQTDSDEFWSWHWTFRSTRFPQPQPLIGEKRVTDLAINVILPWFWMRAVAGKNQLLQKRAEELYFTWPAAEDNAVLRLARQRLLGENKKRFFATASSQQGLLQVVRDFCEHSNAVCANCQFPDLVKQWNVS